MSFSSRQISTAQAAGRLGLSREHVRRLIQQGELHAIETVNGFMLDADSVEQYAVERQIRQDQRQFRAAVDDFATQARRVGETTGIQSAVAHMRDQMKLHSAFEVPTVVEPQLRWIEQQVAANENLAALIGPEETLRQQWHCYEADARNATEKISATQAGYGASVIRAMDPAPEKFKAAKMGYGAKVVSAMDAASAPQQKEEPQYMAARNEGVARGFVITESREARLEEKVDELSSKVEQLTEVVMQQRANTQAEAPTWQEWARSDRPEDVLAKLDAVRSEVTGGTQMTEDSTDIIRAARDARGMGE